MPLPGNKINFHSFTLALAIIFVTVAGFFQVNAASASVPREINYQSRLRSSSLAPITAPTDIQFSIYTSASLGAYSDTASSSGPLVWKGIYDGGACPQITPDVDGYFAVQLGSACAVFPTYIDWNQTLFLGVRIGADAEANPRIQLSAFPYALNSEAVDTFSASSTATANTLLALDQNLNFNILTGGFFGAYFTMSSSTVTSTIAGNFNIQGNTALGSSASDFISVNGRFNTDLVPALDLAYSLGSAANRWNGVFGTVTTTNLSVLGNANFTNITWVNATGTNTTSTNLSATNFFFQTATGGTIIASIANFATATVSGVAVCLQNGVGCASVIEADTLASVTNRGNFATSSITIFGTSTLSNTVVTGTLTVQGLLTLQDMAFQNATGISLNLTNTLYINTIAINSTGTTSTNSGAWLIGVFDEFTFSNATSVQAALRDLDLAIANVSTTEADTLQTVTNRGNSTTNTIQFAGATSNGDILPGANLTYQLGSTSSRWSSLFAGTVYVGSSTWALEQASSGSLGFRNTSNLNDAIRIRSNGNVGIGTSEQATEPLERLHVLGGRVLMGGNTGEEIFLLDPFANTVSIGDYSDWNNNTFLQVDDNAQRVTIPNGFVGIGVTVPTTKLDLHSKAVSSTAIVTFGNNSGNFQLFNVESDPNGFVIGSLGDLAVDSINGHLYIKEFGSSTNSGWIQIATGTAAIPTNSLQVAYDAGNTIQTSGVLAPVQIRVPDPAPFSNTNGLTITTTSNTNHGLTFGRANFGSNFSSFGMSDNVSNVTGASGVFAFYNHDTNRFGFSLLGAGGVSKGTLSLKNTDNGDLAAFEFNNSGVVDSRRFLELSNLAGNIVLGASTGTPEGVYNGNAGDVYFDMEGTTSGGQMYVKTTFSGNTGWVGVATVDMVASSSNITAGNGLSASGSEMILGGVLYQDTVIDGSGGAYDLTVQDVRNFNIGGGGPGATGTISNSDLVLTGTDGLFIRTPNYLTAATGSVLTLTDPLTGRVEFTMGLIGIETLHTVASRGNSTTNTIQFAGATSNGDILPGANLTYSLGSTSSRWSQLFAATVYVGSSTWALAQNADQSFMLSGPAGQARMTVDANGNVAFGVATATSRLHVSSASTSTTPILTLENSGGSIQQFVVQASPEGVVTGSIGDLAIDSSNGLLYIKNTGIATTNGWLSLLTSVSNTLQSAYSGGGIALGRFVTTTSGLPTTFIAGSSTLGETIFRMRDKQNANDVFSVATRDDDAGNELSVLTLSDGDNAGLSNYNRIQQIASSDIFGIFGNSNATDQTVFSLNGQYGLLLTSSATGQIRVSSGGGVSSTRFNMKQPGVPFIDLADPLATVSIFTTSTDPNGNSIASLGSLALNYGDGTLHINVDGADTWSTLLTDDSAYYRSGGNSFGVTAKLGTLDNQELQLITNSNEAVTIHTSGKVQFNQYGAGTLTADTAGNITVSSDDRLKNRDNDFTRGLEAIKGLQPMTYHWKAETGLDTFSAYAGFSAQNVRSFIPEAVDIDPRGYFTLSDRPIIAALVNAVKELDLRIISSPSFSTSTIFVATSTFEGSITVRDHIYLGNNSVGQAKLLSGATRVAIIFEKPYDKQPIVTLTPMDFVDSMYRVTDVTPHGFAIQLNNQQINDKLFGWHAFAAQEGRVTVSDGTTSTIEIMNPYDDAVALVPVVEPTPEPEVVPDVTP